MALATFSLLLADMTRLPPAEAIRHYAAHGMAREVLARIYGAEPVARVMGDDELRAATRIVDPRSLPFGEQLRLARERQRHTQNIAAKIALSPCATTTEIEGYEGGDKQIKDKRRIKRLCDYIGVPVADMMPAILEHNDRAARMRAIYRAPTRVEIAEKRKPKVKPKAARSRLDLTDAALAEAVEMWRSGLTVAEMSRKTGVPAMIYHRAMPRIRAAAARRG